MQTLCLHPHHVKRIARYLLDVCLLASHTGDHGSGDQECRLLDKEEPQIQSNRVADVVGCSKRLDSVLFEMLGFLGGWGDGDKVGCFWLFDLDFLSGLSSLDDCGCNGSGSVREGKYQSI